tara:strand:- start:120 stop:542 length:423 start_codon:yes stop_codon:yes gene_type:complete
MSAFMMSRSQMIDALPDDILIECAKYICIPPVSLLKEIEHYGKIRKTLFLAKQYKYNDLSDFHYELLKIWHQERNNIFIDELDAEQEGVCDLVMSYKKDEQNKVFIEMIKKLLMDINPDNIGNITKKYEKYYKNTQYMGC